MTEKAGQIGPSRRKVLLSLTGAALAGGGVLLSRGRTARAQAKVSKEQVQYQDTPKDGRQCDGCSFFEKPNACKAVEGEISPQGWCAIWNPAA
jgi:hypothetical protein